MYKEGLVASIKVGNEVLFERGENVYIPFGSEYSISLKNKTNRDAAASIMIDGKFKGNIIVRANGQTYLERAISDMSKGNKFKFIEKTAKISEFRGNKEEDGLIEIKFEFAQEYVAYRSPKLYHGGFVKMGGPSNSHLVNSSTNSSTNASFKGLIDSECSIGNVCDSSFQDLQEVTIEKRSGITVEGSISEQKFTETSFTGDGVFYTMIFKTCGVDEAVKEKVLKINTCTTCGTINEIDAKFCKECSTSLERVKIA